MSPTGVDSSYGHVLTPGRIRIPSSPVTLANESNQHEAEADPQACLNTHLFSHLRSLAVVQLLFPNSDRGPGGVQNCGPLRKRIDEGRGD
jgi:hypothetical protein